jgi:hypothetical protein
VSAAPYIPGSETSEAAASSLDDSTLARLEAQVLAEIHARPRTCDDVEQATGLSHQTASARIRGLVLRHLIVDSGERRATRSGRKAIVWRVPDSSAPQPGQPGFLASLPLAAQFEPTDDDGKRDGCLF